MGSAFREEGSNLAACGCLSHERRVCYGGVLSHIEISDGYAEAGERAIDFLYQVAEISATPKGCRACAPCGVAPRTQCVRTNEPHNAGAIGRATAAMLRRYAVSRFTRDVGGKMVDDGRRQTRAGKRPSDERNRKGGSRSGVAADRCD